MSLRRLADSGFTGSPVLISTRLRTLARARVGAGPLRPATGWASIGDNDPMKGDRVEVVVDATDHVREFQIVARRAGRRLETSTGRGIVEVTELTRTGQVVRTARFMASRVIAIVEHPATDADPAPLRPVSPPAGPPRITPL